MVLLNVPYKKPANNVNGLWLVCEDLRDPAVEVWEVFIPVGEVVALRTTKTPTILIQGIYYIGG